MSFKFQHSLKSDTVKNQTEPSMLLLLKILLVCRLRKSRNKGYTHFWTFFTKKPVVWWNGKRKKHVRTLMGMSVSVTYQDIRCDFDIRITHLIQSFSVESFVSEMTVIPRKLLEQLHFHLFGSLFSTQPSTIAFLHWDCVSIILGREITRLSLHSQNLRFCMFSLCRKNFITA